MEHFDINELIKFLEATEEENWLMQRVRSKENNKCNCVMGHIYAFGAGGYDKDGGSPAMDYFEEVWATTYMIYPVNDGENPKYQQPTPKQRVLAYLKDLRDGKEKTTQDYWNDHSKRVKTLTT